MRLRASTCCLRGRRRASTACIARASGTSPSPPTRRSIEGDAVRFVALPDGTLLVEEGPDDSLEPLATAVEQELPAPYRARAARQGETLWAVQARRIEVIELRDAPEGDAIDLTHTADGTTLAVDDARIFGSLPTLDERGAREGREYTVHAERLDGDLWEVRAAAL